MSMTTEQLVDQFMTNPDQIYANPEYEAWNTTSFINSSSVLAHLTATQPNSPHIPKITKLMLNYVKWCFDNDAFFPWESTFPPTLQKTSKEQFIEYYNSQINKFQ